MGELKRGKNLTGLLILIYVILIYGVTLAICSVDFAHGMSAGETDYHQDLLCALDLTPGTLSSFQICTISKLTPFSSVLSEVKKPHLPIVCFSVFKPPELATGLLPL